MITGWIKKGSKSSTARSSSTTVATIVPHLYVEVVSTRGRSATGRATPVNGGNAAVFGGTDVVSGGNDAVCGVDDAVYGGNDAVYGGNDAVYGGTATVCGSSTDTEDGTAAHSSGNTARHCDLQRQCRYLWIHHYHIWRKRCQNWQHC
eukprot:1453772-Rhodomonas_salina.1